MKMNEVEVFIVDGEIVIVQENNGISISPDQASIFCEWVLGAAKAIQESKG